MTVLPIVERELRVSARRRGSYLGRWAVAGLTLLVGAAVYWVNRFSAPTELGMTLFVALSAVLLIAGLMSGVVLTADALSAEHREQTLGLLFLTDLKGYDIVLGKLAAAAIPALLWLLSALPVLAVAVLFGGVTGTAVWQMGLALLSAMGSALALGIAISVWFHDARKALIVTAAALAWLSLGPWFAPAWMFGGPLTGTGLGLFFCPIAPYTAAVAGLMATAAGPGAPASVVAAFWPAVGGLALLSVILLALASAALQRGWHEQRGVRWERWQSRTWWTRLWNAPRQREWRASLLRANPYLWLSLRRPGRALVVWSFLAGVATVALNGNAVGGRNWGEEGGNLALSLLAHFGARCALALAAVHQLNTDVRSGALELLLVTPLSPSVIVSGQMSAMRRLYGGPVAAILGVDVVFAALQARDLFSDPILGLGFVLGRMTMLVTDCVALVWLGTWAALGRGGPLPAAGAALARVLIVPWVILLALLFAAHLMEWEGRISDVLALATWFIVGVANNAYWTVLARWRLPARFRAVSDPWRSKHGWLRRWASLG